MFILCHDQQRNAPRLVNVNHIISLGPTNNNEPGRVTLETASGFFLWDMPFDRAQDVLIDNASQVTAPIAARIKSFEDCVATLAQSIEEWGAQANTPILNLDGMTPEEEARFKASMSETRATLHTIQGRLQSVPEKMLETDVEAVCQLLEDHEWAEHCTSTKLGQRLESAVTEMHNQHGEMRERLEQAEELLAGVFHEYQNDTMVNACLESAEAIGNFLYPMQKSACEKE